MCSTIHTYVYIYAGQNVTVHCTGYGKNQDLNEKVGICIYIIGDE